MMQGVGRSGSRSVPSCPVCGVVLEDLDDDGRQEHVEGCLTSQISRPFLGRAMTMPRERTEASESPADPDVVTVVPEDSPISDDEEGGDVPGKVKKWKRPPLTRRRSASSSSLMKKLSAGGQPFRMSDADKQARLLLLGSPGGRKSRSHKEIKAERFADSGVSAETIEVVVRQKSEPELVEQDSEAGMVREVVWAGLAAERVVGMRPPRAAGPGRTSSEAISVGSMGSSLFSPSYHTPPTGTMSTGTHRMPATADRAQGHNQDSYNQDSYSQDLGRTRSHPVALATNPGSGDYSNPNSLNTSGANIPESPLARVIQGCISKVEEIQRNARTAKSHREKCQAVAGATLQAQLALEQVWEVALQKGGGPNDAQIQRVCGNLLRALGQANTRVEIYGNQGTASKLGSYLFSSGSTDNKFSEVINDVEKLTTSVWELAAGGSLDVIPTQTLPPPFNRPENNAETNIENKGHVIHILISPSLPPIRSSRPQWKTQSLKPKP